MTGLATTPWWTAVRDAALLLAAISGALITVVAAAKLPVVRKPVMWIWRQLTEDAVAAYWRRIREESSEAVEPRLMLMAERYGELGAKVSSQGDDVDDIRRHLESLRADFDAHLAVHHAQPRLVEDLPQSVDGPPQEASPP